jgi:hypothetical protein
VAAALIVLALGLVALARAALRQDSESAALLR